MIVMLMTSIEELKCCVTTLISKENIILLVSMWSFIQENNIATFSNLNIILRIYLSPPISGE